MVKVTIILSNVLAAEVGSRKIEVEASTLKEAIDALTSGRTSLREKILDSSGLPREYVNVYVDGKDYRFLNKLETPLKEGSSISIMPAVSGG